MIYPTFKQNLSQKDPHPSMNIMIAANAQKVFYGAKFANCQ